MVEFCCDEQKLSGCFGKITEGHLLEDFTQRFSIGFEMEFCGVYSTRYGHIVKAQADVVIYPTWL